MKSNGIQKTLAILLSVILALPLFVFATFADDPVFTKVTIYTDSLDPGGMWYNSRQLASDMNNSNYRYATFYLSEDGNTVKIEYTANEETVTELHTRAEEPEYFAYFCILPEFGDALPTSPDGLEDGAYWYDLDGLLELVRAYGFEEENLYIFSDATYRLSLDGKILRKSVAYAGTSFIMNQDEFLDDPDIMSGYLHQVGVDPNAGFILLPTSDEGLEVGDYWFDLESFTADMSEENQQIYSFAKFYLSEDCSTLRMEIVGQKMDFNIEDEYSAYYFTFIHQFGADPNAILGHILLPISEEGLEDGDYWFDAAGLAAAQNEDAYLSYLYYLSEDGNTLRIKVDKYMHSVSRADEYSEMYFGFLRQVGVDPTIIEGFNLLPTSDEGLEDGDYWFDAAPLIEMSDGYYASALFYLSEDETTLLMYFRGEKSRFTRDDEEGGSFFFSYLRQVGVDPNAGFNLLPTSPDGLNYGDYWYDLIGAMQASDVSEEEMEEIMAMVQIYLSEDGTTMRLIESGYSMDFAMDDDDPDIQQFTAFLRRIGDAYLTVTMPDAPVYTGDTVQVTVDLEQNPGLAAMALSLSYDADVLTLTNVQASGMTTAGNLTIGGDMNAQPFNILWDDGTATENHTETGTILVLTFTVKDAAEAGDTTITLNCEPESTFDVELQNVPLHIYSETLTIVKHTPGDADGDGEVDLMDVAVLTRYLAEGWDETVDERNSDVNGDGILDLKDVVLIRRSLAGGWGVELV